MSISAVTPNIGSAAGGWTFKIAVSPTPASVTGVTINGNACTGVSLAGNVVTATSPAFGNANGSSSAQTIIVTSNLGKHTSSSNLTSYWYLPSNNTPVFFLRADAGVTIATGVSQWNDQSPVGNNFVQATGANQPTVTSNWNGTGLPALTFNGTSQYMTRTLTASIATGVASLYVVGNWASTASESVAAVLTGTAPNMWLETNGGTYAFGGCGTSVNSSVSSANTLPHAWSIIDTTTCYLVVDETSYTGAMTASGAFSAAQIGAYAGPSLYMNGNLQTVLCYSGGNSTTDDATVHAILKANSGTP